MRQIDVVVDDADIVRTRLDVRIDGEHSGMLAVKTPDLVQFVEVLAAGSARKGIRFQFDASKIGGVKEMSDECQVVVVHRSDLPGPAFYQLCTKRGERLLHEQGPSWMLLPRDAEIVEVLGEYDQRPTEEEWAAIEVRCRDKYPEKAIDNEH